jgi:hypothetical protein
MTFPAFMAPPEVRAIMRNSKKQEHAHILLKRSKVIKAAVAALAITSV